MRDISLYKKFGKRGLDFTFAIIGLVFAVVPMAVIAVAIKVTDKGPVFFRQVRIGKNGKEFKIYKFRSMKVGAPIARRIPNPDDHITKIGKFLRASSLDEVPQIFNIITGEMSFIGPRPVPAVEKITMDARRKNGAITLRPGITGWAQINGRDEMTEETRARYDGEYIHKIGFAFDATIVAKTVLSVITKDGYTEVNSLNQEPKTHFVTKDNRS